MWQSEDSLGSWFSQSTMWVPGIEFKSSLSLGVNAFTCWTNTRPRHINLKALTIKHMVNRSSFESFGVAGLWKGMLARLWIVYAIKILNSLVGQFHPDKIQTFPTLFIKNFCLSSLPAALFQGPKLTHAPATFSGWGFCGAWESNPGLHRCLGKHSASELHLCNS